MSRGAWLIAGGLSFLRALSFLSRKDRCDFDCYTLFGNAVLRGERDYEQFVCPLGPAYYPAVNLWFYALHVLACGWSYSCAQVIGAVTMAVIHLLAAKMITDATTMNPVVVVLSLVLTSFHSMDIAVSKVSNDSIAVVLAVACVACVMADRLWAASIFYSLAVGMKMNNLFYGPALLVWYLLRLGLSKTVMQFALMGSIQLGTALPFLLNNPSAYLSIAFSFSRRFTLSNNYAWRWLPEWISSSSAFNQTLLACTLAGMIALFAVLWPALRLSAEHYRTGYVGMSNRQVVMSLFVFSNAIGFVFCRGVHVQFLLWISWTLPFIFSTMHLPRNLRVPEAVTVLLCFLYDEAFRRPIFDMLRVGRFDLSNGDVFVVLNSLILAAVGCGAWKQRNLALRFPKQL